MSCSPISRAMVALCGSLALAGCADNQVDPGKARKLVRQAVAKAGKTSVETVSCPKGIKIAKGRTFDCQVRLTNGSKGRVTVHVVENRRIAILGPSDYHVQ